MSELKVSTGSALDDAARLIRANWERVDRRLVEACAVSGRQRQEITLVAVTKGRTTLLTAAAYRCGLHDLGENRIEELEAKRPEVAAAIAPGEVTWHMIGHVQSRKSDRVAAAVSLIHSVDSVRLAERLERFAASAGRPVRILLQVNVSGEETKSGFAAATPEEEAAFIRTACSLGSLEHLQIEGLMTIAPIVRDPEQARPVFRRTRLLRDVLRQECPYSGWGTLSMGMSDDFEIAVQEGATMVRIGRALFEGVGTEEGATG